MQREGQARRGCGRFSRDSAVLKKVGGVTIPPVVARILSGDSTSPLTREARTWCGARDSADTKPYKHTQTLALRKVGGIVRFCNGCGDEKVGGCKAIPPS